MDGSSRVCDSKVVLSSMVDFLQGIFLHLHMEFSDARADLSDRWSKLLLVEDDYDIDDESHTDAQTDYEADDESSLVFIVGAFALNGEGGRGDREAGNTCCA